MACMVRWEYTIELEKAEDMHCARTQWSKGFVYIADNERNAGFSNRHALTFVIPALNHVQPPKSIDWI